ncbi:hypothetical protein HYW41_04745 [Candidatus Daviesbacteria bacterium]|nr:hypothetical protein [Candidatus Daviesbacteria bacterium]
MNIENPISRRRVGELFIKIGTTLTLGKDRINQAAQLIQPSLPSVEKLRPFQRFMLEKVGRIEPLSSAWDRLNILAKRNPKIVDEFREAVREDLMEHFKYYRLLQIRSRNILGPLK